MAKLFCKNKENSLKIKGLTKFIDFNHPLTYLQSTEILIPLFHFYIFNNESHNKMLSLLNSALLKSCISVKQS